ncbi:MAG: hypothetical protein AB1801_06800 [Chloroflexota bacterium]
MTLTRWDVALEGMPGFDMAMKRVYAWYAGEIIDRPPVRFVAHNAFVEQANTAYPSANLRDRWFDAEFQVDTYLKSIAGQTFHGETFPVFWPNLGPEVYAAFYGAELIYGEVTSWSTPLVQDWTDLNRLKLDPNNPYFTKLEELTRLALEKCRNKSLVGYTDLHPGVDCAAAWRDPQQLCLDLYDVPDRVKSLIELAIADFEQIYNHFDAMLKAERQLSVSWMGIPSFGKMHIPSCDFSAMISSDFFEEFCLPVLQREVKMMTHNIFHVDGKGVARHLDYILAEPGIQAVQWVQGVGDDYPILQWVPLIKEIQAKKPVIIDLQQHELEPFIQQMEPEGLFLWIATRSEAEELAIIERLEQWR